MWHLGGSGKLGKLPNVNCPRSVGNRIKLSHSWPLVGWVVDHSQVSHLGSPFPRQMPLPHPQDHRFRQAVPRILHFIHLPCYLHTGWWSDPKVRNAAPPVWPDSCELSNASICFHFFEDTGSHRRPTMLTFYFEKFQTYGKRLHGWPPTDPPPRLKNC